MQAQQIFRTVQGYLLALAGEMQAYAVAQAAALQQAPFPEHLQTEGSPKEGVGPLQPGGQLPQQRQVAGGESLRGDGVLQPPLAFSY